MATPSAVGAVDPAPLDDLMLAMDVVDTLRHRELLVERELGAEERDARMMERLRAIYAAQGIEVSDHVLAEGVRALRENRFSYTPPAPGLKVGLARLYVSRGRWGKPLLAVVAALAVLLGGYQALVRGPQQSRLAALPGDLAASHAAILDATADPAARERADQILAAGRAALGQDDPAGAADSLDRLRELQGLLAMSYELRVVSEPGERSGVWRVPDDNPGARNYYLIVEAIDADGKAVALPVASEEDGRVRRVERWGLRVDEATWRRVAADKQDDGIIQDRRIALKRPGALEPEYLVPTSGAAITSW